MSRGVDVVGVANDLLATNGLLETSPEQRVAMARVVLAAAERVKGNEHDILCPANRLRGGQCDCGHDALVTALRGGGDE